MARVLNVKIGRYNQKNDCPGTKNHSHILLPPPPSSNPTVCSPLHDIYSDHVYKACGAIKTSITTYGLQTPESSQKKPSNGPVWIGSNFCFLSFLQFLLNCIVRRVSQRSAILVLFQLRDEILNCNVLIIIFDWAYESSRDI